jgi:hypothetical protein
LASLQTSPWLLLAGWLHAVRRIREGHFPRSTIQPDWRWYRTACIDRARFRSEPYPRP